MGIISLQAITAEFLRFLSALVDGFFSWEFRLLFTLSLPAHDQTQLLRPPGTNKEQRIMNNKMKAKIAIFCLLIALVGCRKIDNRGSATKLDACALLTRDEIQAVQGSTITDAKSSENLGAGLRMSQCYFVAQETNRSV